VRQAVVVAVLAAGLAPAPVQSAEARASLLQVVEGEVVEVGEHLAEGGLPALTVSLRVDGGGDSEPIVVVLGPQSALDEIGFEVAVGDRLRVRLFVGEERVAYAQKVMNTSRRTMLRLRTLRQVPLWSASGRWDGGPPRSGSARDPGRRAGPAGR
jgi:hypothetical protein